MTHEWAAVFSALESELLMLRAVLSQYDDFVKEVSHKVAERLRVISNGRFIAKADNEDEHGKWYVFWEPTDELGVFIYAWASAAYNGPPGWMRVGIFVRNDFAAGMVELPEVIAIGREALAPWISEDLTDPPRDVCEDPSSICIGFKSIPIKSENLIELLAQTALEASEATKRVGSAFLKKSSFLWLRSILNSTAPKLQRAVDKKVNTGTSDSGYYVQSNLASGYKVWATALPDGTLGIHWNRQTQVDVSAIMASVGGESWSLRSYSGLRLMSSDEIKAAQSANDRAIVSNKLHDAFVACWVAADLQEKAVE